MLRSYFWICRKLSYVAQAEEDVGLQLSRAGVRLVAILNKALR